VLNGPQGFGLPGRSARAESPNLRSHSTRYSIIAMRPDLESAAVLSLQEAPQKPQSRPSIETGYGLAAVGRVLHGAVVDWLVGVCAWLGHGCGVGRSKR
jgi:hypothetical protein